ncbi:MAG TPA: amidohydrolase [Streptosporangiaceae bacterium]|nr:amidohydrolase [Streptosporangiaceae bacterium]
MATKGPSRVTGARADVAFVNGPVYTVDAARSWTDAVAVRGGRIAAVGGGAVRPLIGAGTEVIDLAGKLLLPGFVDAHVHPVMGGTERALCDLTGTSSAAECLGRIADYAREHPDRTWILGGGWSMDQFPRGTPSRLDLDAVVPGRPVYLTNRDHHGAWVNTRALELAGVGSATPDPEGGRIERDGSGSPQGTLHEDATMLVAKHTPPATAAEYAAGLLEGQRYLHSLGITGWQDAIIGPYLGHQDILRTYLDLAGAGGLTARVAGALWWDRSRGEEQIGDLLDRREAGQSGRFKANTVKIMQDGVCENFSAAMLDPYLDGHGRPTTNRGHSFIHAGALARYVTRLDAEGFQVHFHAIGDRAVRESLDAVAAARAANGWHDHRHHIAHIQVVHPGDIRRFRDLGVAANMQPLWATADAQMRDLTIPFLGQPRSQWQYPFGSLRASGAVLAAGSDWPVSSPDPLHGIHTAVNRTGPGNGFADEPFLPGERLALGDAIAAYTIGSAWVSHLDREAGSIETGKYADLIVLDRNPFAGDPGGIAGTRVEMTFVQGTLVHALAG